MVDTSSFQKMRLKSMWQVFAEMRFRQKFTETKSTTCLFSSFYKNTKFYHYCECTQIKVEPVSNDLLLVCVRQKI